MIDRYLIIDCTTSVSKLEAGTPYLIKWDGDEDIIEPVFTYVTIDKSKNDIYIYDNKVQFGGIYFHFVASSDYLRNYIANGSLVLTEVVTGLELMAHECYFYITSSDLYDSIDKVGLNFGDIDETITGIERVPEVQDGSEATIYNLAGQRLGKTQKGINIVNGKKILIK